MLMTLPHDSELGPIQRAPKGTDPRVEPTFIEHPLEARAKGLRRKVIKLAQERKKLMTALRANHEAIKKAQSEAILAETQLFEVQDRIIKLKAQTERKPKPAKKPPTQSEVISIFNTLSEHERAKMIREFLDSK